MCGCRLCRLMVFNQMTTTATHTASPKGNTSNGGATLHRTVSLPFLVFYGVGVTVGAGIFALSGEVVAMAGDFATWSFLLAGAAAGLTAVSYSVLSSDEARAAGEAWYVSQAFGKFVGTMVGLLLVLTAIFSSAAITVSFSNYAATVVDLPIRTLSAIVLGVTALVALKGIRETVIFSALITTIEVGVLLVIVFVGFPSVEFLHERNLLFPIPSSSDQLATVFSGAVLAFFAFIGFEDIVNMGDETIDAKRNLPIAILCTLAITMVVYVLIVLVCVSAPDRQAFLQSGAPLAYIFEANTNSDSRVIAICAAIAMINGILVQIVMSSRVLFGLSREAALPRWFSYVHDRTRTPVIAILFVVAIITVMALTFSLVSLATYSSLVLLAVFCMVNLSLWVRGRRSTNPSLVRWRYLGLFSFMVCMGLIIWQLWSGAFASGH